MGTHRIRFNAQVAFTLSLIVVIVVAIVLSLDWPAAAKPVPMTACYMALTAAGLNLINELFGQEKTAAAFDGGVDGGVHVAGGDTNFGMTSAQVRRQATLYFGWLAVFMVLVALVGFLPAIAIFVFAYMCFGFGEPPVSCALYAAGTTLLCWGLFDRLLAVAWPHSLLGDLFPALRSAVGFI